jgi:hypothetical protein
VLSDHWSSRCFTAAASEKYYAVHRSSDDHDLDWISSARLASVETLALDVLLLTGAFSLWTFLIGTFRIPGIAASQGTDDPEFSHLNRGLIIYPFEKETTGNPQRVCVCSSFIN